MSYIIIHDYDFVEGFSAMIFLPLFSILLKNIYIKDQILHTTIVLGVSWLLTWFIRKISVNIYKHFKKINNWKGYNLYT